MHDDLKAAGKFITDVVTDGMVVYPFFTVLAVIAIPILLLGGLIYLILDGLLTTVSLILYLFGVGKTTRETKTKTKTKAKTKAKSNSKPEEIRWNTVEDGQVKDINIIDIYDDNSDVGD